MDEELARIKAKIDSHLGAEIRKLRLLGVTRTAVERAVAQGGKRLRAMISYIVSKTFGLPDVQALGLASAVEFSHAFTLVHDDLIDRPEERRGRPPLFKDVGDNIALLIGDVLFSMSFGYLSGKLVGYFARYLKDVIEGQILDVLWMEGGIERNEGNIKKIQQMKTSSLFKISFLLPFLMWQERGGSVRRVFRTSAGDVQRTLEMLGHHFGFAFQILDDIKDVDEDSKRGSPNISEFLGRERAEILFRRHRDSAMFYLSRFEGSLKRKARYSGLLKYLCIRVLYEEDLQPSSSGQRA